MSQLSDSNQKITKNVFDEVARTWLDKPLSQHQEESLKKFVNGCAETIEKDLDEDNLMSLITDIARRASIHNLLPPHEHISENSEEKAKNI